MARAQPLKALANVVEQLLGPGEQEISGKNLKIAYLNAHLVPGTYLDQGLERSEITKAMICEQSFRPQYLELKRAGFHVLPDLYATEGNGEHSFDFCLVVAGKFRQANENMLRRARELTVADGLIIVAGENNSGIKSLRKKLAGTCNISDSRAKYHSLVFWFQNSIDRLNKNEADEPVLSQTINTGERVFKTAPGLFSADAVDPGSAMLANHFDDRIGGRVADLGAGWGYLSAQIATRSQNIRALDIYEADWHGVKACENNLRDINPDIDTQFHWHDVVSEAITGKYDCVIMNPPFHQGRETRLDLGQAFIEKAAAILRPGGQMLMVANRQLGYERTIASHFASSKTLKQADGYKVILANKKLR